MSSSPPGAESSSGREYATIWHPVREWFEANEDDDDHQIPELESPERQAYSDEENGAENEDEEEYEDGLRLFGNIILPCHFATFLAYSIASPTNRTIKLQRNVRDQVMVTFTLNSQWTTLTTMEVAYHPPPEVWLKVDDDSSASHITC